MCEHNPYTTATTNDLHEWITELRRIRTELLYQQLSVYDDSLTTCNDHIALITAELDHRKERSLPNRDEKQ